MNGQEDWPPEYGMELFGGKWNSRIICVFYKDEGVTPIVRCPKYDHERWEIYFSFASISESRLFTVVYFFSGMGKVVPFISVR